MINYAVKHRFSYLRWKQNVNNMIYNEQGNQKVHRLRVIHIYKSDLNFLLGLKWKTGLHHGMKLGHLHEGQYGSIPVKQPQTICLLEELRLDYSLFIRTPYCNFDSDLTSCYDRILLPLRGLIARGMGIHRNVVFVHATTLEEAGYKLKIGTRGSLNQVISIAQNFLSMDQDKAPHPHPPYGISQAANCFNIMTPEHMACNLFLLMVTSISESLWLGLLTIQLQSLQHH